MIISMSDIICVTNRRLCCEDFLMRIEKTVKCRPAAVLLREKDLPEAEYEALAASVTALCGSYGVPCILHTFVEAAVRLHAQAVHLPLPVLRGMSEEMKNKFRVLGTSCHSVEEAAEAERLGCTYLIAGHIFETDCKDGLFGRGLPFLRQVSACVAIPVWAIGGIGADNAEDVRRAGAQGICVMSGIMRCADVEQYMESLRANTGGVIHETDGI